MTTNSKEFLKILQVAFKAVQRNPIMPVLGYAKCFFGPDGGGATGCSGEVYATATLPGKFEPVEFMAPLALMQYLQASADAPADISVKKDKITVAIGGNRAMFDSVPTEEFNTVPDVGGEPLELDAADLSDAIAAGVRFSLDDVLLPQFSVVEIAGDGKNVDLLSSNRHTTIKITVATGWKGRITISHQAAKAIAATIPAFGTCAISEEGRFCHVSCGNVTVSSIKPSQPLIPTANTIFTDNAGKKRATFDARAMHATLQRASLVIEKYYPLVLSCEDGLLSVTCDAGTFLESVPCEHTEDFGPVKLHIQNTIDIISQLTGEATIFFESHDAPVEFSEPRLRAITMPII